ncbi:MAG TPA: 4,5-DOPA dioxygenase extradiol [Dehalococcoidales bacterium]|nr:4,5-DOPA dioxygenase extradiol [Dehalococcoidales bacterium]
MSKMPVLFIGHGSPMNMVAHNDYTRSLEKLGKTLARPKAILVISAHYLTNGTYVTAADNPRMIYDFYGFPEELYSVKYSAPGAPEIAREITATTKRFGIERDEKWGLDHAAYAVLRHIFPQADIPVLELSIDYSPINQWKTKPLQYYYDLAKELSPLREKGVLIMGSGNIVHNLRVIDFENVDAAVYPWARDFDERVKRCLTAGNYTALLDLNQMGLAAALAVPTLDHYLPMVQSLALQGKGEPLKFIFEGFQNASISMRAFQIG